MTCEQSAWSANSDGQNTHAVIMMLMMMMMMMMMMMIILVSIAVVILRGDVNVTIFTLASCRCRVLHGLYVVLLERGIAHAGGTASEQFVALCRLGERDDVAEGGGVAEQSHKPERDV